MKISEVLDFDIKSRHILRALMSLITHMERHYETVDPHNLSLDKAKSYLEESGFAADIATQALAWLEVTRDLSHGMSLHKLAIPMAMRRFNPWEDLMFRNECWEYLYHLEMLEIITPDVRELVIDRVVALKSEDIDVFVVQWVTLMVLYYVGDEAEDQLSKMQMIIQDGIPMHSGIADKDLLIYEKRELH